MYSSGYNNSNQVIFENGSWHSRLSASFVVFIAVKSVRWSFIPKIVPVGAVVFLIHLYVLWVLLSEQQAVIDNKFIVYRCLVWQNRSTTVGNKMGSKSLIDYHE